MAEAHRRRSIRDMTKAIMDADPLARTIMFDCQNHADDHDACTIMATLCNVLVEACFRSGQSPTTYKPGHVRIDISNADDKTIYLYQTVFEIMKQAERQMPEFIRIY